MHLADLNWMDVRNYLLQDDRIILITGSTEQHGYLSLQTDLRIPRAIATICWSIHIVERQIPLIGTIQTPGDINLNYLIGFDVGDIPICTDRVECFLR